MTGGYSVYSVTSPLHLLTGGREVLQCDRWVLCVQCDRYFAPGNGMTRSTAVWQVGVWRTACYFVIVSWLHEANYIFTL